LRFDGDWNLYIPISKKPELIFANNFGGSHTFGEGLFYLMPGIGNKRGLRGFRNNRFVGQSVLFENIDLRLKLIQSNNKILPFDLGILGGYDMARVWQEGESSDKWHSSQTIGLWIDILGLAIVQPYYSFTDEGNTVSILLRFNF